MTPSLDRIFIGQGGTGKQKAAGMNQKEQKAVLTDFREGRFNVLVGVLARPHLLLLGAWLGQQ